MDYPESLLQSGGFAAADPARQWLVLYTKSKQEQALARDLLRLRIPFYLPLVPRISLYGRRPHRLQEPLFGSYVFLFANDDERVRCLMTNRVSRVIRVVDQETLQADLGRLEQLIKAGLPVSVGVRPKSEREMRVRRKRRAGKEFGGEAAGSVVVALDLDRGGLSFEFTGDEAVWRRQAG